MNTAASYTSPNQAPISWAFMFENLAESVALAEKSASEPVLRKKPEDLTQLRADVVLWLKKVKKASCRELTEKFGVTPRKMAMVLGVLALKKIVRPHEKKRAPDWELV